ncbi:hypothetical protein [Candidatus Nitrospira bockiana]
MTSTDVVKALRDRFPKQEYAFLPQVRNGTGFSKMPRTADVMVMGLWPSRGLELQGFEIKVHRGDWLREKRNPEKAEEIAQYCDRWWIVADDATVVQKEEMPPGWGLLVLDGGKLRVKKEAPKLKAKPITREFLAAMLRKAQEVIVPRAEIERELREQYDAGLKDGAESAKRSMQYDLNRYEDLKRYVKTFEESSGVCISAAWNAGEICQAVRFLLNGGVEQYNRELMELRDKAAAITTAIDQALRASTCEHLTSESQARVGEEADCPAASAVD